MMKTNKVMGRGLDALLSSSREEEVEPTTSIASVALDRIDPNPDQPRKEFDAEALKELGESIRSIGLVQPITLQALPSGRYMLIAGERRYRAAKAVGLSTLPAYIRETSPEEVMQMALVENIQREDLNAIEIALSLQAIAKSQGLTHEKLAQQVGKSRASVTNYLRLLRLPAEIQLGITQKQIEMGHAKALLQLEEPASQIELYHLIVEKKLSVREVEKLAKSMKAGQGMKPIRQGQALVESYALLTKQLSRLFSSEISLQCNDKGRGKLVIPFEHEEQLEHILQLMERIQLGD